MQQYSVGVAGETGDISDMHFDTFGTEIKKSTRGKDWLAGW
jgi:hypothetical protein